MTPIMSQKFKGDASVSPKAMSSMTQFSVKVQTKQVELEAQQKIRDLDCIVWEKEESLEKLKIQLEGAYTERKLQERCSPSRTRENELKRLTQLVNHLKQGIQVAEVELNLLRKKRKMDVDLINKKKELDLCKIHEQQIKMEETEIVGYKEASI